MSHAGSLMTLQDGEFYVVLNGIRHWVRIAAAGRSATPVIALHGGPGGNHYVFERTVLPRLAELVTTICYEQRGCGRSDAPKREDDYSIAVLVSDLDALRSAFDLERILLLGYSFGAELALEYAIAHPSRVLGLILQAPSGVAEPERTALVQLTGFAAVARDAMRHQIQRIVEGGDTPVEKLARVWATADSDTVDEFLFLDQAVAKRNRASWYESGLSNTGAMARALKRHEAKRSPLRDRVTRFRVPTVVLVGRHDRNVGPELCRELVRAMPDAHLHVFERSAHFPDLEEPEKYVQLVGSFCAGVTADPRQAM